jgi:hypothetical protein
LGAGLIVVAGVGGGEVAIGKALGEDRFGLLAVQGKAFGLLVLFVPGETQPAEALKDGLDAGLGVALDIGVVQTQDHGSVVVAGIEPIEDKGAGAADVQEAGGRGGKADAGSLLKRGSRIRHRGGFFPFTMLAFAPSPAGADRLIPGAAMAAGAGTAVAGWLDQLDQLGKSTHNERR